MSRRKLLSAEPLAVVVVTSGSRGNKLLFRHPCTEERTLNGNQHAGTPSSSFSIKVMEDLEVTNQSPPSAPAWSRWLTYSDMVLDTILAVQAHLCSQRFDLKIDDVRFIGHPVSIQHARCKNKDGSKSQDSSKKLHVTVNIVFALPETVSEDTCACYHDLAKQVATALKHEERRCCYFCTESKQMWRIIDEQASGPEGPLQSPSKIMLERRLPLAVTLASLFDRLYETGVVQMYMNNWSEINFCLPLKVHNLPFDDCIPVTEGDVYRCINLIRPYHALLLLGEQHGMLAAGLPVDSSPALTRLLRDASPFKSLQELALDIDCDLSQVFKLAMHLVYWARAAIVYPLCDNNVYTVSPNAATFQTFSEAFERKFVGEVLAQQLAQFSLPLALRDHQDGLCPPEEKKKRVQMVLWMLQRRLLVQLHDYVSFVPSFVRPHMLRRSHHASVDMGTAMEDSEDSATSESGSEQETESFVRPSSTPFLGAGVVRHPRASGSVQKIGDLAFLTQQGHDALLKIDVLQKDIDAFVRLAHFFDGRRHLEDIMYYSDTSRSDLFGVIEKFSSLLCTFRSVDEATAYHCSVE